VLCAVRRKLKILATQGDGNLFIGVSAPDIQPDKFGYTHRDPSSYGIWSFGDVWAAGKNTLNLQLEANQVAASIIRPDMFSEQRHWHQRVFAPEDEVTVTLDCAARTVQVQSPTVDHVIPMSEGQREHQWVLNLNFYPGMYQVQMLPSN